MMISPPTCKSSLCLILLVISSLPLRAQPNNDLHEVLEQATKAAIARAAPVIVQIQTVGGTDVIGGGRGPEVLRGQGPTTGLIVSADGYIISSSFNFAHKPSAITVSLPDGKLAAAKVVAHDRTRLLTLLKVEAASLPVPEVAPKKDFKLGQWVLALGRSWSSSPETPPSVSVGIISATERIWGKAVQTDAKVSPVNYGGPLVDLQGRVVGILVPLSPRAEGETAGLEWYDSGIGFAVPLEDINRVLPKLKAGKDLKKGLLGITLRESEKYGNPPVVGSVAWESSAAKAGIKANDQIIAIEGVNVLRQAQILHVLGKKYEGDGVALKIKRGDQVIDLPNVELAGESVSFRHAFLGILPMRDDPELGLDIRAVFPKTPADGAKLKPGDRITKVEGRPFAGRGQLLQVLNGLSPGMELKIEVKRKEGNKTETVTVTLAEFSDALPKDLPPGSHKRALQAPKQPGRPSPVEGAESQPRGSRREQPQEKPKEEKKEAKTGHYVHSDSVTGREYWVYVPENYDPNISHALLVWLHPAGDTMEAAVLQAWQELCKKHHIILLGCKAENPGGWLTSEVDYIKSDIREVLATFTIDRQRVVLHGQGNGAELAYYLAFDARDLVRGVATLGGRLASEPKENIAQQRLSFFLASHARDQAVESIRAAKAKLIEKKFPVFYREFAELRAAYLPTDTLHDLVRWIDSLDRL